MISKIGRQTTLFSSARHSIYTDIQSWNSFFSSSTPIERSLIQVQSARCSTDVTLLCPALPMKKQRGSNLQAFTMLFYCWMVPYAVAGLSRITRLHVLQSKILRMAIDSGTLDSQRHQHLKLFNDDQSIQRSIHTLMVNHDYEDRYCLSAKTWNIPFYEHKALAIPSILIKYSFPFGICGVRSTWTIVQA